VAKANRAVNLAVIGAGYWGRKVISEYLALEQKDTDFNLAKVCDLLDDNIIFCKEKLNISKEKISTHIQEIIDSSNIDAVHICTPNETHFALSSKALFSGKNVLLEKPMSLTTQDAWKLCDIAQSKGLTLQVGHIYRFNNALKKIKELIKHNYFGEVYYLKMQWTTLMPSQFNRDIIFDLGPHPVDIMNYLLGQWPKHVSCSARAYRRGTMEEMAYLTMEFNRNILAHVELSWLQPGKVRDLNIIGSERSATIDCVRQTISIHQDNEYSIPIEVDVNNTIFDEAEHFIRSIRDENNHKNPGPIGASNIAVLESLKESKAKGKFVKVNTMIK
jgi:UDP-N-acetylglucosamine 3-dehydrogenase